MGYWQRNSEDPRAFGRNMLDFWLVSDKETENRKLWFLVRAEKS